MSRSSPRRGAVEQRVRADVAELGDLDGVDPTLAELAYRLAAEIDGASGEDRRMLPALSRELRAVLARLDEVKRDGDDDEDDLDGLGDPD